MSFDQIEEIRDSIFFQSVEKNSYPSMIDFFFLFDSRTLSSSRTMSTSTNRQREGQVGTSFSSSMEESVEYHRLEHSLEIRRERVFETAQGKSRKRKTFFLLHSFELTISFCLHMRTSPQSMSIFDPFVSWCSDHLLYFDKVVNDASTCPMNCSSSWKREREKRVNKTSSMFEQFNGLDRTRMRERTSMIRVKTMSTRIP